MAEQLKRWESPRRKGRNDKGRGGSARQRQLRKQFKALSKKLKQGDGGDRPPNLLNPNHPNTDYPNRKRGSADHALPLFLFGSFSIRILGSPGLIGRCLSEVS